jgi:hypothetical protein
MKEKRTRMRKGWFGIVFIALVGLVLSAGSVWAAAPVQLSGYLMGDPAPGKLVPYYRAGLGVATLIGIESVEVGGLMGSGDTGRDIAVMVTVFTKGSTHVEDFGLCLSPFDFSFLVLQSSALTAAQQAELAQRFAKARVLSVEQDKIPPEGYVTLKAMGKFNSHDGTCGKFGDTGVAGVFAAGVSEPLATWAILANIESGFFATEIPTPTVIVDDTGQAVEKVQVGQTTVGAYGLIPENNRVFARFDVNPKVGSKTEIFVWMVGSGPSEGTPILLHCEDEFQGSALITLTQEINVLDPDTIPGIGQCKALGQYRGVIEFKLPNAGFLWSHISQEGGHFRQNYLGYSADCNTFIDPECDGAH